jgi:uncharacterized protein (DUF2062 family)
MPGLFRRRIVDPLKALLLQGITPEKIAMSLALGATISVLPVLGTGTILCTVAALGLRLNLVAMQVANWIAYPLQLILLIPFFRAGAVLFRGPSVTLSPSELAAMFKADFWGSISALWTTTWQACVVWALVTPLAVGALYVLLAPVLRRLPIARTEATA